MITPNDWKDYELIDTGDGEKLERWGPYTVIRPDPQIIWPVEKSAKKSSLWQGCHMHYHRSKSGGGSWEVLQPLPKNWTIGYGSLRFRIQPTDFKHMGLFPEQAANWKWLAEKITKVKVQRPSHKVKILNLFGYTGGATSACAAAGATVCHVDAAKAMNQWAKENLALIGRENSARFITDDVLKFVQREERRGSLYDGIIMDPPSYGRGPGGEVWKIEDRLYELVSQCEKILTDRPLFFLINSYTTGFSPVVAENILKAVVQKRKKGHVSSGEVGLMARENGLVLPCGIFGRWEI